MIEDEKEDMIVITTKEEKIMEDILKDKTDGTKKTYRNAYKLLKRVINMNDIIEYEVNELIDIIQDVNYLKDNTKAGLINIYYLIIKQEKDDEKLKIIDEVRKEMKIKLHRNRIKNNKCLIDILPTAEELKYKLNKLYENEEYENYVMNYLMINLNVRNQDLILMILDSKNKMNDPNINYLIMNESYILYIRHTYKTYNTYGRKTNRITNAKFTDALKKVYQQREKQAIFPFLMYNEDYTDPLIKENIGTYVKNKSIDKLGETKIAKVMIHDADIKPNTMNKLKKISNNRGTDVATLSEHYNISMNK
tara:strand:- start:783 stop:1703 length:921 start_codon:yes stop_codon:yes gene_type:complete